MGHGVLSLLDVTCRFSWPLGNRALAQPAHKRLKIARLRYSLDSLPTFAVCLPNMTFETRLVFHRTRRQAELLTWGAGIR